MTGAVMLVIAGVVSSPPNNTPLGEIVFVFAVMGYGVRHTMVQKWFKKG
jgi:hypothetical protein